MPTAPTSVDDLALALLSVLPKRVAFSHETAARIHKLPLPTRWSSLDTTHVMTPSDSSVVRRRGVQGHRGLEDRRVVTVRGLPVLSMEDTWLDLCGSLDPIDLVVVGDPIVGREGSDLTTISSTVISRRSARGSARARDTLPYLRPGVRSPQESRARFRFVSAGLPEPDINVAIHDEHGQWLAEADLAWRTQRLIGEVDGDYHRGRQQWQKDIRLRRRIVDAGWRIEVITGDDLLHPGHTVALIERFTRLLASSSCLT